MKKLVIKPFLVFMSLLLCIVSSLSVISNAGATFAEDITYEETNVLDDLSGMTIDGKAFSLTDYNFDESKSTQIIALVEYCYSFYSDMQDNYGLYVYVYNPKGLSFSDESELNSIQLRVADKGYKKYGLKFLNKSLEADFNGLFYKFKIELSDVQRQSILDSLNSTERVYDVSGFELLIAGEYNATEFTVGGTYKYSGYCAGYGPGLANESTLTFIKNDLETLKLDVHTTFYRPDGTNGKNDFTQDSLHSVYFAVPKKLIAKYGEMYAVHATWLNAVLNPAVVSDSKEVVDALLPFLGKYVYDSTDLLYGFYHVLKSNEEAPFSPPTYELGWTYNVIGVPNFEGQTLSMERVNAISSAFYTNGQAVDNYVVQSEEIVDLLKNVSSNSHSELVYGKYMKSLFESVDDAFTEVNLTSDDFITDNGRPLTSQKIEQAWWQKLWGTHTVHSSTFDGISALEKVENLTGGKEAVCSKYFIAQSDYEDFEKFYNANYVNNNIYLFRYMMSDYTSQPVLVMDISVSVWGDPVVTRDSYAFKQTVNLDFDIIDVTFKDADKLTVIPVIMSPIDVVHDGTPPPNNTMPAWLPVACFITVGLLAVVVVYYIVKKV